MLEKFVLTILELNWNQRWGHKRTKLNICHHMRTSSTQLQNRSFHVVERTRTSSKCQKKKDARAKRAKILFFIVRYANLWGFCCRRRHGCLSSLLSCPILDCSRLSDSRIGTKGTRENKTRAGSPTLSFALVSSYWRFLYYLGAWNRLALDYQQIDYE